MAGDPIPDRGTFNFRSRLENHSGALDTWSEGKGHRVAAGAVVDVDKVHTDGLDADERFPWPGLGGTSTSCRWRCWG